MTDLGDVIDRRLNRWQRRGLAGRAGKNSRRPNLVGPLYESNRELGSKGGHSPAPCLTSCGIQKAERLKIIPGVVQKPLGALIIDIETPYTGHLE